MDSTFMGVLAMVGCKGRQKSCPIEIVNIDQVKRKLLKGLGLERLFIFSHTTTTNVNWESLCNTTSDAQDGTQLEKARSILEAHEALVDVDKKNKPKFKNVIEFLKEDIKKLSK